MLKQNSDNLIWIDLEMSGLNVEIEHILEIATIVTDKNLNNAIEGPSFIIHQSNEILDKMNTWCKTHHNKSGLSQSVRESNISLQEAEKITFDFIKRYSIKGQNILCGNSIGQDQKFIAKYMPKIFEHLHYHILDVSSVKEIIKRWYNHKEYNVEFDKKNRHRALDDIRESIEELKYFRQYFFLKVKK